MLTLQKEWELVGGISSIPFYTNEVLQFFHEKGLTYDRIATYHKIKGVWKRTYANGYVDIYYPITRVKSK